MLGMFFPSPKGKGKWYQLALLTGKLILIPCCCCPAGDALKDQCWGAVCWCLTWALLCERGVSGMLCS